MAVERAQTLNETPAGSRLHIAIFGRRNAGKSSLINALTSQQAAIVSEVAGTTTDPVRKAMEILPLGPADQANVQRPQRSQRSLDGGSVAALRGPDTPVRDGVVDRLEPGRRQLDVAGPVQDQHETAANHVTQLAVGLHPVPSLTDLGGKRSPAQTRVLRDPLAQEEHIGWADLPAPIREQHLGHEPQV